MATDSNNNIQLREVPVSNKIEIEIPEWAKEQHIYVFAGDELLAIQDIHTVHQDGEHILVRQPLRVKPENGRCTGCASCCNTGTVIHKKLLQEMKTRLVDYEYADSGPCPFLDDDGCILGSVKPFSCVTSICSSYEGCTEVLE